MKFNCFLLSYFSFKLSVIFIKPYAIASSCLLIDKMPRQSLIPVKQQLEIYIQYKNELFINYCVKPVQSEIFLKLQSLLKGMTVKAIYLSVKKLKDEIWGMELAIDECKENKEEPNSDEEEEINENEILDIKYSKKYVIKLNNYDLNHVVINKRNRLIKNAPPNWTSILMEILWEVVERIRLCPYSFRNHQYIQDDFVAKGNCVECGGYVLVRTIQNGSLLEIFLQDGDSNVIHRKKRKLDGTIKNEVEALLEKNESSYNIRNSLGNNYITLNNEKPPFLPESKQIANLKYRKNLSQSFDVDPLESLRKMKYSSEYKNSIHFIGYDPFFTIYWHPYQKLWYEQYCKHEDTVITFDSTGSVVLPPKLPIDDTGKHVFLFNICAITKFGTSKPIGHMLSQCNTSNFISFMLNEMFSRHFKKPMEVIMDDSPTLMLASVKSFTTSKTTKNYLYNCFCVLNGDTSKLPECFLRLDVSHFVNNVMRAKEFKHCDYKVKLLYKCAIGVLINTRNFSDFKTTVKDIITLALNEFYGFDGCKKLPAEEALDNLKELIKVNGIQEKMKNLDEDEAEAETEADNEILVSNKIIDYEDETSDDNSWLDDIINSITITVKESDGSRNNFYCNKRLLNYFKRILCKAPLWSNLMISCFESQNVLPATSGSVENSFKDTKQLIFANERLPIRADRFVQKHLDGLEGLLKIAIADQAVSKKRIKDKGTQILLL